MDMLRNGTHLLVTDIDNIFTRRVPLRGFLAEGYDVYHAYEMKFPLFLYDKYGFVICGGHSFFRSSPETLRFMDIVMKHCNKDKCNDQIMFNNVLFHELDIAWDGIDDPNHAGAMRLNTTGDAFKSALGINNILVEGVTGRSKVTNHTIKIWDRDFAWRVSSIRDPALATCVLRHTYMFFWFGGIFIATCPFTSTPNPLHILLFISIR